jgi:hypothetical protein
MENEHRTCVLHAHAAISTNDECRRAAQPPSKRCGQLRISESSLEMDIEQGFSKLEWLNQANFSHVITCSRTSTSS